MFRSVVLAAVAFVLMGNPVHAEEISLRCTFTDGSKLDGAVRQTVHGKPGKITLRHFSVVENGREGTDIVGDISNRIVHLVSYSTETGKDVIIDLPTGKARKRANASKYQQLLANLDACIVGTGETHREPCYTPLMNVIVPIPDDLVASLSGNASDLSRRALEALAAEECRAGRLTSAEVGRMLGIETQDAIDGFLKAHGVFNDYTVADRDLDMETLRNLGY